MLISRRAFLETMAAVGVASAVRAQAPAASPMWGSQVIDCHFHFRRDLASDVAHLDGSGTTQALVLTRVADMEQLKALQEKYPGRFPGWAASVDVTKPDAEKLLREAVKNGATGLGEIKSHVACDGPEMQRMYALAAELNVPIMMHFQEVEHMAGEGLFNTGFATNFDKMLKAYPKTRFVGHADAFWANVSADYKNETSYPKGPIKRGGITDRWLSEYPNLFADLSANSGNNALTRGPTFTADFLERHQDKLHFGSDCTCTDGKGGGDSAAGNPAGTLVGKCVARETLAALKKNSSPEVFHKLVWVNGRRVYRLGATT